MRLSVIFVVLVVALAAVQPAQAKCGTRGGPGYRNQAGNCVGWESLARQCGKPPTTRCIPEDVAEGADDAIDKGIDIQSLKERSHQKNRAPEPATK
jgi:hypothetical protein